MDPNGIDPGRIQQVNVNVPAPTISDTIEAKYVCKQDHKGKKGSTTEAVFYLQWGKESILCHGLYEHFYTFLSVLKTHWTFKATAKVTRTTTKKIFF